MQTVKIIMAVFSVVKKALSLVRKGFDLLNRRKEKEKRAKRRTIFWTVFLSVVGVILVVLFFPYRFVVKRNDDFEIRTLLIRIYRRGAEYKIPKGGNETFEISTAEEHAQRQAQA